MIGLLGLTGPPGAGKSTLARALADRYGAASFCLPEVALRLREDNEHVPHLLVDPDPASRYGDAVVAYCLRHTFLEGFPPDGEVIVFDGLPASPAQVGYLHALAALRKVPLHIVELTAPQPVLRARLKARHPGEFVQRLASWGQRVGQIRNAAVVRHRSYHLVEATASVGGLAQRVWAACFAADIATPSSRESAAARSRTQLPHP